MTSGYHMRKYCVSLSEIENQKARGLATVKEAKHKYSSNLDSAGPTHRSVCSLYLPVRYNETGRFLTADVTAAFSSAVLSPKAVLHGVVLVTL